MFYSIYHQPGVLLKHILVIVYVAQAFNKLKSNLLIVQFDHQNEICFTLSITNQVCYLNIYL